ncbi:sodium-translocating pyrophosphatase [Candidatus Woesearchaeota archaeon]|nr:sodium-translocating pyrophosphatase [Candidatus Woesearchaeota archaeon]
MIHIGYVVLAISFFGLIFSAFKLWGLSRQSLSGSKSKFISEQIHKGAMAFLNKEYSHLIVYALIFFAVIYYFIGKPLALAFLAGGLFSGLAGNISMRIATYANIRTVSSLKKSIAKGLNTAFSASLAIGISIVSIGLICVTGMYMIFHSTDIIFGFGLGASLIALFSRVGGGIFTKAADIGADLVGKIEKGIPEDDHRNPAVIADNVGDNVGDVTGMGADLFESYVDSLIAAMILGLAVMGVAGLQQSSGSVISTAFLPLVIAALGIASSISGSLFVYIKGRRGNPRLALNKGIYGTAFFMAASSYFVIGYLGFSISLFYTTLVGLLAGLIIGISTEYFTSSDKRPTRNVAEASKSGPATNIIAGLSNGMMSTVVPVLVVAATIYVSFSFAGLYGIALAAVGMLSTLGMTLAISTYGPIADNSEGITQMAEMGDEIRKRAESLDAAGNTTAAIGKGFAIGSTALTALALFVSFKEVAKASGQMVVIDVSQPHVMIGLFIGALLPFIFSSLTISAVGKAANKMVKEVRRQFSSIKGLMEGKVNPDYDRCINISTGAALKSMIIPSFIAVISPILIGLWDLNALGGLLAGSLVTGFILAIFMANAGGSWDNAKKYIEGGHFGGKGSNVHKAAVVGDTVGDPLKDASGPSLNILIKLMTIVAIVFVPLFL